MEQSEAIFSFYLGKIAIDIKPESIVQLVIVLLILVLAWWSTRNMQIRHATRTQMSHQSSTH